MIKISSLCSDSKNFQMFKGDNHSQTFKVTSGGTPVDITDAELIFSMKLKEFQDTTDVQKKNLAAGGSDLEITMSNPIDGNFVVNLDPIDTEDLKGNTKYFYDVEMVLDSNKKTIIKGTVLINQDITN